MVEYHDFGVCVEYEGWFMSAMSENVGDKDQEPIIAWVA